MRITHLSLARFRSYESFSQSLDGTVLIIAGPNGSGKTNLLEALSFIATGTSFRGRDRDLIAHDRRHAAVKILLDDGNERRALLQIKDEGRLHKEFNLSGTKKQRLTFAQRLPVVLFDPDSLRALSSSPTRRRDFLDTLLGRLQPSYSPILHRYERTLLQRNELLKNRYDLASHDWRDQLFVWNVKLAELATKIVHYRGDLLVQANQRLPEIYSLLAAKSTKIEVIYDSKLSLAHYQQSILSSLEHSAEADALRGFTSHGPHRDDLSIMINSRPATEVASRGEMRTIMLAFKLMETEMITELYHTPPLILLDDVFSELDHQRRQTLLEFISDYQTIITTTDADIVNVKNAKILELGK